MWSSLSSLAYHTLGIGDPIVKELETGLGRLQKSEKKEAALLIKTALMKLQTEEPSAFEEARRSGSGRFIDIIKASVVFADKLLFEKDIVKAGNGNGFRKTENGYQQKKCSADGQEVFKNAVSVEEFPGVSCSYQTLCQHTRRRSLLFLLRSTVLSPLDAEVLGNVRERKNHQHA